MAAEISIFGGHFGRISIMNTLLQEREMTFIEENIHARLDMEVNISTQFTVLVP